MPTLGNGPSPKQFANAWTRGFAAAVRDAAGKDGRLSINEAKKIGMRDDNLAMYGDNASNYLEKTGQKTVSVEKLIEKGHDYAFALAERVSGGNNRVSLTEAQHLPADLRADFMALRGRADPGPVASKLDAAALTSALTEAVTLPGGDPIYYMSEGDYPVVPFSMDNPTGRIDANSVAKRMESELTGDVFDRVTNWSTEITAEGWTKAETSRFFAESAEPWFGMDDTDRATAEAFGKVGDLLGDNLKDVRMYKLGNPESDGSLSVDNGMYAYVAVGQTEDGKMAGVYFGAVET